MSPVAQSRGHAGKAIALAFGGVFVAIAIAFGLSVLASRGDVEINVGDDRFHAGDAESIAEHIADDGPIPYSDVAGGNRDIIVQHIGDDPKKGWVVFDARVAGAGRECTLEWDAAASEFVDPCSNERFPASGEGLATYPVAVVDGDLEIDLRRAEK